MATVTVDLKPGTQIKDHRPRSKGRVIKLDEKMNPMGTGVGPYWRVINVKTGRKTLIREDQLAGKRWEQVS